MQEFRSGFDSTPLHATKNYFPATEVNDVTYNNRVRLNRYVRRSFIEPGEVSRAISNMEGVAEIAILFAAMFDIDKDRRSRARRHLMITAPYMLPGPTWSSAAQSAQQPAA